MSCNSLFIEEDPINTFESNFKVFWEEFDRHYSYFELKDLDWQLAYDTNIQVVRKFSSTSELRELLSRLVLAFEDGHVNLYPNGNTVKYDFRERFPENSPENASNYLTQIRRANKVITYGLITGTNLGYISLNTFSAEEINYKVIDQILIEYSDLDGIVIDVRDNRGGSDINSELVASRFAESKKYYRYVRYRNGPAHDNFTGWIGDFVEPEGVGFTSPVVVLTNRDCYSSTESFLLSMRVMPHATLIGGVTGGGSGNPIVRELPNGWLFRLSSWQMVDAQFEFYEGIGITPDISVEISEEDRANGVDTILETAIAFLNND